MTKYFKQLDQVWTPVESCDRIHPRQQDDLLVFSCECTPNESGTSCRGAFIQVYLDVEITSKTELAIAASIAGDVLEKVGWKVKKHCDQPIWMKMPGIFSCIFSRVARKRRSVFKFARKDGVSYLAFPWKQE